MFFLIPTGKSQPSFRKLHIVTERDNLQKTILMKMSSCSAQSSGHINHTTPITKARWERSDCKSEKWKKISVGLCLLKRTEAKYTRSCQCGWLNIS